MTVSTALQQNLDKVQAAARDIERLEERAGQLRAAMLQLLVDSSTLSGSADNDTVTFRC